MGILFPKYGSLVTGGAIGDGLFFFCSGFTLFMGRQDSFPNWYKRRINRIYPTIIMWALVSAVIFNWNWQITDLITTPKYWFIPCIMVYYVIFYLIRTYLLKYLNQVFGIVFLLVAISSFWVLDFNHSVMYAAVPFMRIYSFYDARRYGSHQKIQGCISSQVWRLYLGKSYYILCTYGNL